MINFKDRFIDNDKIRYLASLIALFSAAIFAVSQIHHLFSKNTIEVVYYLFTTVIMVIFPMHSIKLKDKKASMVLIPFNIISIAFIFDSSPILHLFIEGRNNIFSSPLVLDIFSMVFIVISLCLMIAFSLFLTKGVYKNLVLYLAIINVSLLIIQEAYNYIIYDVYYFPWSYLYKALFFASVFLLSYSMEKSN
ncbi:hypothetical protein ACPWSR_06415 [Alloiococcus sp. CFN-8]|uniref:hypothetical protein n=1 Tax=Alloiococcus sp. CFN-8 TaxID=3416081 RepID=UPI003CF93322